MAENISGLKANEMGSATRIVIQPSRGWSSLGLKDVWEYRELLYFMILREIQGRYRQTALGFSWMFLRPLLEFLDGDNR